MASGSQPRSLLIACLDRMGGMMMDLGLGNSSSAQPSQQLQPSSSRQQTRTMDSSQRPRKRARMACTWCHERKVRCDVSIHGSPCTNCRLDGHECTIRSSACRGRGVRTQLQWPEPHSQNGTLVHKSDPFVPPSVIKSAGFVDSRIARNTLYRRAKLLFDLNAENDVLAKAQGAILLTYQSSSIDFHAGSLWLTTAIQHAILYGAHSYNSKSNVTDPHRGTKKRLWWSILLRDRILPLGLRRYPQITPQHFDLSLDCMAEEDLQDEIQKSEVYNAETKRILANVLRVQCQLAIVLTRVIMIVYAPNGFSQPKSMTEKEFMKSLREIEDIRATLTQWANEAKAAFGSIFASDDVHESVTLYSNLTFMYYHHIISTARVALCHNQALTIEIHQRFIAETYSKLLEGLKDELEDAALSITRSVKRLLMRGVARHLPISAIAYTALPLVLNALDVKLSGTTSQSATRKRRLSYYAEVMQLYRNRYDGTDYVALLIQEVLRFVEKQNFLISFQPDESSSIMSSPNSSRDNGKEDTNKSSPVTETSNGPAASNKRTKSWSEVFIRQPRFYLRLSLSIDFAFARGQYPRDTDLPALVRELHLRKDSDQAIETMQPNIPVEVRLKSLPPLTKSQPQPPNQQEQEQEPQQPGDQFTVQDADVYYGVDGMTEVPNPEQQQEQQPQQSHQILVSHPPPADHNLAPQLTTDQLLFNNSTPSPVNLREVNLDFLDLESPLLDSLNGGVELGVRADDSGEDGDFTFGKVVRSVEYYLLQTRQASRSDILAVVFVESVLDCHCDFGTQGNSLRKKGSEKLWLVIKDTGYISNACYKTTQVVGL
ncbi:hypothetical protein RJ035_006126 [Blastomyces gilchristii]